MDKPIKLFIPDKEKNFNFLLGSVRFHELPFVLEGDKFEYVNSPTDFDFIPMLVPGTGHSIYDKLNYLNSCIVQDSNPKYLLLLHTHQVDGPSLDAYNYNAHFFKHSDFIGDIIQVHTDAALPTHGVYYNFYWNRSKAYFTDYAKFDLTYRLWTHEATEKMFELRSITDWSDVGCKLFLSPNKAHADVSPRSVVRRKIRDDLLSLEDCYYSDNNNGIYLISQEIGDALMSRIYSNRVGWQPVHNFFYQHTIVSLYCETIASNMGARCITEKTFDPLIKGHFILPYSYPGIIRDLKEEYGFAFPSWIDYTYDTIEDDELRYLKFVESGQKLREMWKRDKNSIIALANNDLGIIEYNRSIFYSKEYDSLYDKLQPLL